MVDGDPEVLLNRLDQQAWTGVECRVDPVRAAGARDRDVCVPWDGQHLDLTRLWHQPHDDDHVGPLSGLGGRAPEGGGLPGTIDEGPGIGAHEKDVDRRSRSLRCDSRNRNPLDRAQHGVDIEPTPDAAHERQYQHDRHADGHALRPSAALVGVMNGPAAP